MITIIIVGAGGFTRHLATTLTKEQQNVVIVDKDETKLEMATKDIEVGSKKGSGTDWELLDELLDLSPKVLLALTESDETNLVTCAIAKNLGYPRTIARLKDNSYLNCARIDFGHLFSADAFISPEIFVADDIFKYMTNPESDVIESFAHGAVQLRSITIPENWRQSNYTIKELNLPEQALISLINRKKEGEKADKSTLIFPHGDTKILPGDELILIAETDIMNDLYHFFGLTRKKIESVMIIGGSKTGLNLCYLLEKNRIGARIIEKSYEKCCLLADQLRQTAIIHHDGTDLNFLKAEKANKVDIFVACTGQDDSNLLLAQLAKEAGCQNVVTLLSDKNLISIAENAKINKVISPYVSATNHLLSQIFSGTVNSLITFYNNRAEVMEINVSHNSKVIGIPISELGPLFPQDFLIALIENRGRIMVAKGNHIISPGDTIIVVSNPKHLQQAEKIF